MAVSGRAGETPIRRRWRKALGGYVLVGLLSAWVATLIAVALWGRRDAASSVDAIVVLGAAQYAGRPSPVLRARLDHATDLWKRGLARWMIVTGGKGAGDTTSEAAVSRRYLLRRGIPDRAVLLEGEGRTTTASLRAAAGIMRARGLERAILVSDPFHMLRLSIEARRFGLVAVPSPTRTSPISSSPSQLLGYVLSESVKVPVTAVLTLITLLLPGGP